MYLVANNLSKCFAMQSILIVAITILKVPIHILHIMSYLKQPRGHLWIMEHNFLPLPPLHNAYMHSPCTLVPYYRYVIYEKETK